MDHNIEQNFYDYIDSLGKKPGSFTREELFEIGKKHRELPRSSKNWASLARYVGYPGAGDSYRKFVSRKLAAEADMQKVAGADFLEAAEYESAYRQKTQIRDIYNAYRRSLRNEARVETFKEALLEAIKAQKTVKHEYPRVCVDTNNTAEAILMVSDMHLGCNCDNFYNKFNYDIAKDRLHKLAVDTIHYCKVHKVQWLNVVNLGDLIHGNIHVNARISQQFNLIDQIVKAAELMYELLAELAEGGLVVSYRSCTDNHSRAIANKEENIESENFNRLIDWYLEAKLAETPITMINDNIDESLGKFELLNGKTVMFAHGHLENVNKCIDAFCGATKQFIDYVLLSHYHAAREKSYNGSKLVINGSIVGTEQYALSRRLFGPAEQKLLIFDRDNFLDLSINLQ